MKLSTLANQIQTSPILTIAAALNARKADGETINNLTVEILTPGFFLSQKS